MVVWLFYLGFDMLRNSMKSSTLLSFTGQKWQISVKDLEKSTLNYGTHDHQTPDWLFRWFWKRLEESIWERLIRGPDVTSRSVHLYTATDFKLEEITVITLYKLILPPPPQKKDQTKTKLIFTKGTDLIHYSSTNSSSFSVAWADILSIPW